MDQDDYTRAWHRTLRHCLRVLQRHRRAVQIAKPTNSDEEQIASDQLQAGHRPRATDTCGAA